MEDDPVVVILASASITSKGHLCPVRLSSSILAIERKEARMLTRVRFEASASTQDEVRDELLALTSAVRSDAGGEWEVEEQTQNTKNGWWGYMTIKRREDLPTEADPDLRRS